MRMGKECQRHIIGVRAHAINKNSKDREIETSELAGCLRHLGTHMPSPKRRHLTRVHKTVAWGSKA